MHYWRYLICNCVLAPQTCSICTLVTHYIFVFYFPSRITLFCRSINCFWISCSKLSMQLIEWFCITTELQLIYAYDYYSESICHYVCFQNSSEHLQVPWYAPCGGAVYGDGNLVFIANDWHTALLPVYLKAYYRDNGLMQYARSVLVIHNIAHQVLHLNLSLPLFSLGLVPVVCSILNHLYLFYPYLISL